MDSQHRGKSDGSVSANPDSSQHSESPPRPGHGSPEKDLVHLHTRRTIRCGLRVPARQDACVIESWPEGNDVSEISACQSGSRRPRHSTFAIPREESTGSRIETNDDCCLRLTRNLAQRRFGTKCDRADPQQCSRPTLGVVA